MSVQADLDAVARYGTAPDGGVTRFAWSKELEAASDWLRDRLAELGLEPSTDAAGNVFGRWPSGEGGAVLVGSHLDTVPSGGRYDGALGVCAALEAVRLLREWGVRPARPVWVVSFMDEEGSRFGTGMLGSRAFVGEDLSELGDRADAGGTSLREAMAERGHAFERLPEARGVDGVSAYLELHIEQGPRLLDAEADVGVVTGVVGLLSYRARFAGEANHAGTTPMASRRDALAGAARAVLALRDAARATDATTANVGVIRVEPGGFNVVPGLCEFTVDVRAPGDAGFDTLPGLVRETLETIAADERLDLELVETHRLEPCPMDPDLVAALERAAEREGASSLRMESGAGHDAMILGRHVPAAMLFAPSRDGISHNPAEYTAPEDCERGARVLARALQDLVG
jgi:hydantoinase/carbamoylase family amidase